MTNAFRIDPTEGLLQYVNVIKPYHTKVLDVFVEYVYNERMKARVADSHDIAIKMTEPLRDFIQTGGYGIEWDQYGGTDPSTFPRANIISATAETTMGVRPIRDTSTLACDPESSPQFAVGVYVTIEATPALPVTFPQIDTNTKYQVVANTGDTLSLKHTNGVTVSYPVPYTGSMVIRLVTTNTNTFVVSMSPQPSYPTVVSNATRNQLAVVTPYDIIGVIPSERKWVVQGDLTQLLTTDSVCYVAGNTFIPSNVEYTIESVSATGGITTIVTKTPISLVATPTGKLTIGRGVDELPYWPLGVKVKVISQTPLPSPLVSGTAYHYVPSRTGSHFSLSTNRYPHDVGDRLNLALSSAQPFMVTRAEPFVPSDTIKVEGSAGNDGVYTVESCLPQGNFFIVKVKQVIPVSTALSVGVAVGMGSFGSPTSTTISTPYMHAAASFRERIAFDFGASVDLLDTFTGAGSLANHMVDSGHSWEVMQSSDSLTDLIVFGGRVTTVNPDIWVRSNWQIPEGNLAVSANVLVGSTPLGGTSSYFSIFAKESASTFYGPSVELIPTLSTGKVSARVFGGSATSSWVSINTDIALDSMVTVSIHVTTAKVVTIKLNGIEVFSQMQPTMPVLSFVGFSSRVPSGSDAVFQLSRYSASTNVNN